jgi:hypothetical protein
MGTIRASTTATVKITLEMTIEGDLSVGDYEGADEFNEDDDALHDAMMRLFSGKSVSDVARLLEENAEVEHT